MTDSGSDDVRLNGHAWNEVRWNSDGQSVALIADIKYQGEETRDGLTIDAE